MFAERSGILNGIQRIVPANQNKGYVLQAVIFLEALNFYGRRLNSHERWGRLTLKLYELLFLMQASVRGHRADTSGDTLPLGARRLCICSRAKKK